jgi:hypothetical protein
MRHIFIRSLAAAPPCRPCPPFRLVFLLLQTTRGWDKSGWAVVRNLVWCQSLYRLVSGPGLWRLRGGRFAVGPGLSQVLSGPLAPHLSGHVPETGGLYRVVTHHTPYSLCRPDSFNLDLIGLLLLVRK